MIKGKPRIIYTCRKAAMEWHGAHTALSYVCPVQPQNILLRLVKHIFPPTIKFNRNYLYNTFAGPHKFLEMD